VFVCCLCVCVCVHSGIHIPGHRDIVRCLSTMGNKVFSAGYVNNLNHCCFGRILL